MFNWLKKIISPSPAPQHAIIETVIANIPPISPRQTGDSTGYKNSADQYFEKGKLNEAAEFYRKAITVNPNHAEAYNNLGNVLCEQELFEEAEQSLKQAILIKPDLVNPYCNLGALQLKRGRPQEAIENLNIALKLKPDVEVIYRDLCYAYFQLGQLQSAKEVITQGLSVNPEYIDFHLSLGNLYYYENECNLAIRCYQNALLIQPNSTVALINLGKIYKDQGNLNQALSYYRSVLALNPDHRTAMSMELHLLQRLCEWKNIDANFKYVRQALTHAPSIDTNMFLPFTILSIPGVTAEEQKRCAEIWVTNEFQAQILHRNNFRLKFKRSANNKISIGYISPDFRQHPVSYLMAEIFKLHDRSHFNVTAYSSGPDDQSAIRKRLKSSFDNFVDIHNYSDKDAASLINADKIDILVDLTGHTQNNRAGILALRPAPIQVNYLGYPATMGADFIDYIIADRFTIPAEMKQHYTEKVVWMPDCFQANDNTRQRLAAPSRMACGLPDKGFVFCCFNQTFKFTPEVFDIWCRLLKSVQGSVLWLPASNALTETNLRQEAVNRGVGSSQLIMAPILPFAEHWARMQCADLFLDTLPYNAGTTCSDALWMGLPVVTCAGDSFVSRMAGSLLTAIDVPELITYNLADYYRLALDLATDRKKLETIRNKIIANRETSILFNSERFTRNLEKVYLQMMDESIV